MLTKQKFHSLKWGALAATAAVLSTGCAEYELRKLDKMQPQGSEFSQTLAKEYKNLSAKEIRINYDDTSSMHFAEKGQEAAKGNGESVLPDEIKSLELPSSKTPEFEKARARLVSALKCNGRKDAPKFSAKAQAEFDNWAEEAEERFQVKCIEEARLAFYENLRLTEEVICPLDKAPQFHVYFRHDSDKVDSNMEKVLDEAAASATTHCHCKVFLTGSTDASGTRVYNADLSKRRADSVKSAMTGKGIEDHRLIARGHGEWPGSPQHSRKNRHVEIIIH